MIRAFLKRNFRRSARSVGGRKGKGGQSCLERGFTIVELLVATTVLLLLMVAILTMTDSLRTVWRMSRSKVEMFRNARMAFSVITQRIRQATLNTYIDYDNANAPTRYVRNSYLHFISGPVDTLIPGRGGAGHAVFFTFPSGYTEDRGNFGVLSNLISGCGYYVEYSQDPEAPSFLGSNAVRKWRWRLKQFQEPVENSIVQANGWTTNTANSWFSSYFADPTASPPAYDMADNVILLLLLPMLPKNEDQGDALAPKYTYDSRTNAPFTTVPPTGGSGVSSYTGSTLHQLPPLLRVVMVVIDEESATHLDPNNSGTQVNLIPSNLFKTAIDLDDDLVRLESSLQSRSEKIKYRIFDSTVSLRGAKWSRN